MFSRMRLPRLANWPQESFFIYFCSNLWPGLSSSSLDCSAPTRSPIAWFAEFFFLTRDISWRSFERIFQANKLFKPLSFWLPELSEIVKLQQFLYLLEVFLLHLELLKSVHFILQSVIDLLQACSSSLLHYWPSTCHSPSLGEERPSGRLTCLYFSSLLFWHSFLNSATVSGSKTKVIFLKVAHLFVSLTSRRVYVVPPTFKHWKPEELSLTRIPCFCCSAFMSSIVFQHSWSEIFTL